MRWQKKLKHRRVGEKKLNFFLGGEKNTLLKKLLVRLPCAFFKSVFFLCGGLMTRPENS